MTDDGMRSAIDGWTAFCEAIHVSGKEILESAAQADPVSQAEALRYLTRLLRGGIEKFVEYSDEKAPYLANVYNDNLKWGLDNPDSLYAISLIEGTQEYEITGNIGTVNYFNITSAVMSLTAKYEIIGVLDGPDLETDAEGNFIIHVGGPERATNWVRLTPESNSIMVRQTFADRVGETEMSFAIRSASERREKDLLTMEQAIARLANAQGFFSSTGRTFVGLASTMAKDVNKLPPVDQAFMLSMGGDPNYAYFWSAFRIELGEALLIHFPEVPDTDTWNLCLYNYWLESLDYRKARILINKHSAVLNPDGSVTIVICNERPGDVDNWLDPLGHGYGNIMSRWTNPDGAVRAQTELVRVAEVDWEEKFKRWPSGSAAGE